MEDAQEIEWLFAEITAAAEEAASLSLEGHVGATIALVERTRLPLVRALLILQAIETRLQAPAPGPTPLIAPSALTAAIEQNRQRGLDFTALSSIHGAKPGDDL